MAYILSGDHRGILLCWFYGNFRVIDAAALLDCGILRNGQGSRKLVFSKFWIFSIRICLSSCIPSAVFPNFRDPNFWKWFYPTFGVVSSLQNQENWQSGLADSATHRHSLTRTSKWKIPGDFVALSTNLEFAESRNQSKQNGSKFVPLVDHKSSSENGQVCGLTTWTESLEPMTESRCEREERSSGDVESGVKNNWFSNLKNYISVMFISVI